MSVNLTESHKLAISNGMRKFFDGGGIPSMRGRKHSDETKEKMSKAHKGVIISEWHKNRLRELKKGKPLSKAHIESLCVGQKRRFKNGGIIWSKGKSFTDAHKDKLSLSHIGNSSRKKICKFDSRKRYAYLHNWIKRHLKKLECENCKCLDRLEYANKSGLYKQDVSDWIILCKLCHARYDQSFTEEEIRFGRFN